MSASKYFLIKKVGNESDHPLARIERMLSEHNIEPDLSFFRSKNNRVDAHRRNPESFLKVSNGIPVFPIRNQHGGVSYTVIKRGISAAKTTFVNTRNPIYLDIIKKLEHELKMIEMKISEKKENRS